MARRAILARARSGAPSITRVGRYPKLSLTLSPEAQSAVSDGNSIQDCA